MKEHPILFSTEMVKAVLDGRKTQTRRIAKLPEKWHRGFRAFENNPNGAEEFVIHGDCGTETISCPYGAVGDRLWVREAWCYAKMSGYDARDDGGEIWYRATDSGICEGPWKPSIHMFRKYARIFLEIINIRVERVQDISWEDCKVEGITLIGDELVFNNQEQQHFLLLLKFNRLWDTLNAKRGYGWDKNPFVWCISFKKIGIE